VTCLIVARRLNYVTEPQFQQEMKETAQLGRMLHGLAASLEERLDKLGLTLCLGFVVGGLAGVLLF